jgi:uncharacterized protein (TIGR03083 family)
VTRTGEGEDHGRDRGRDGGRDHDPAAQPATGLADLIRTERLALVDLLRTLPPQEWETPSLCRGWTVQDVAAHLAWAPVLGPLEAVTGLCRAGFRLNAFAAGSAVRWSRRGRAAILDQLRDNAANDAKPMGVPRIAALADALVHGIDIRRPLGRSREIPPAAFVPTADWQAGVRWPMTVPVGGSVRRRIAGVRLVADDLDWSHGHGPEVHASAEALLLVLTGRRVGRDELSGAGAARIREQLSAPE